jgi:hypothetical protein
LAKKLQVSLGTGMRYIQLSAEHLKCQVNELTKSAIKGIGARKNGEQRVIFFKKIVEKLRLESMAFVAPEDVARDLRTLC